MMNEASPLIPYPIELLILLVGLALFAWWLTMLIEALRIPAPAGQGVRR